MFKPYFILGIVSSAAAIVASCAYSYLYAFILVDFSEGMSTLNLIANNLVVGMSASFLSFGLYRIFKNIRVGEFVFNLLFSMVAIAFVFVVMNANEPVFKNENAVIFAEFYKGFLMPMIFFPVLTWFTFKPLILQ